ncbi:MAG: hypothetical protein AB8G77_16115 [Rhodothermales bacterium]
MKKHIPFVFVFIALILGTSGMQQASAQDETHEQVLEEWNGSLNTGSAVLRLKLEVEKKEEGKLKAVLISVDQGSPRIPVDEIMFEDNKLTFSTNSIGGSYSGTMNDAGNIAEGTWYQGGIELPLKLTKKEADK